MINNHGCVLLGKGPKDVVSDAISAGVTDYRQKESGTDQDELLATRITNAVSAHRAEHLTARLIHHTSDRAVELCDVMDLGV